MALRPKFITNEQTSILHVFRFLMSIVTVIRGDCLLKEQLSITVEIKNCIKGVRVGFGDSFRRTV